MRPMKILVPAALLISAPLLHAEPPLLKSTMSFLPQASLEDVVREVAAGAREQKQNLEQPGWRLRVACEQHPLPQDLSGDGTKPVFAWTCESAWESRQGSDAWTPQQQTRIAGMTEGDRAALKQALRQGLLKFLEAGPPPAK